MSKYLRAVSVALLAMLPVAAAPAVAGASPRSVPAVHTQQARFGARGLGRRPAFGSRYRTRSPYTRSFRRTSPFHGLFGGMLRLLGIAYLFHLLFGIGAGGSPFGLLLLVALVAYLVGRARRPRRPMAY